MRRFYFFLRHFSICCVGISVAFSCAAQCPITVNAGEDVYLCTPPTPTQLQGSIDGDYLNFSWTPTAGLSGAQTLTPTVSVNQTTTYVLTGRAVNTSINLISNGDFEGGNGGFSSNYLYSPGDLWPEGVYEITDNPQNSHANFAPCGDHTSGSGQMMAVNGNGIPNQSVWCQTVIVQPNTQYAFSAWATSLVAASPAVLQFSVNGTTLGTPFSVSPALCNWQQFYALWNSGFNTTATICVVNQNTAVSGNDFALDDIGFSPVCTVTDTVVAHVVNVVAAASPASVQIPCEGFQLTLNGTGSSTGPNIFYEWDTNNGNIVSGWNTLNPVVDAPGAYTLTVTFDNGFVQCTKTATVNVIPSPPLLAWINPVQPLGCGGNTTLITANGSQGNVSYLWETLDGNIISALNLKTITVNQPGTYMVTVTNNTTGCTATAEVNVTTAANPPVAVASAAGTISCLQPTTTLSGTGSSTGANISYAWSAILGGNITNGQNTLTATVNGAGVYTLAVTNSSNNCITVDTVSVTADILPPALSVALPDTIDCGTDTVAILSTAGPMGVSYLWSTSNGQIVSPLNTPQVLATAAGQYQLTVTNPANGCTTTATTQVVANLTPPNAVAAAPDSINCVQSTVALSGAGTSSGALFHYSWTGPGIVGGANSLAPIVNAPGNYTLIVTNQQNNCQDTAATTVFADANAITAIANAPDTLDCVVNSMSLNSAGSSSGPGFTYQWTTPDGMIDTGADTPTPTVSAPGVYILLLTNPANGCTSTDQTVVIQDLSVPSIAIQAPDTLTCAAPTITLNANVANSPAFQLIWSTANGNITSAPNQASINVNAPGAYQLTATNLLNGCTAIASVQVPQEAGLPVVILQTPDTLTCLSPSITINGSGSSTGMNIQWTASNGGQLGAGANTLSPSISQPGDYQLLLTNTANGCTATGAVSVVSNQAFPPALANADGVLTCAQPAYNLIANNGIAGPYTYIWQTQDGHITSNPAQPLVSADSAGVYTVLVTDPTNSCSATDTVIITANQIVPPVSAQITEVLTCTRTNVAITLQNAAPGYTYQWQTSNGTIVSGQQTAQPTVNQPGTYEGIIIDPANGCSILLSVPVQQDTVSPMVQIAQPGLLTCAVTAIPLTAVSGTVQYQWSTANGQFAGTNTQLSTVSVNAPGTYEVLATNIGNGCTAVAATTVAQDTAAPLLSIIQPDTLDCQNPSASLQGIVPNGTLVIWTTANGQILSGANTTTPLIGAPGDYLLQGTNPANGCSATLPITVFRDNDAPIVSIAPPPVLSCALTNTSLNANASATGPATYLWQASNGGVIVSGANTLTPVINQPGDYAFTITDTQNGCTATAQVSVQQNIQPPAANIQNNAVLNCNQGNPTLSVNTAAGHLIAWSSPNGQIAGATNGAQITAAAGGLYLVTVTDPANGCTSTASGTVAVDTLRPAFSIANPAVLTCALTEWNLEAQVTQPATGQFLAHWSTLNGQIVNGDATLTPLVNQPGLYLLQITNTQNGCTQTANVSVSQNVTPPLAVAMPLDTITCLETQPQLNAAGSSVGNYQWSGPQIVSGANTLQPVVSAAGAYQLTVTDPSNGCTATTVVNVLQNLTLPELQMAMPDTLNCLQSNTPLTASVTNLTPGQFSFVWSTANGQFAGPINTLQPIVNAPGTYQILVTNTGNGCTNNAQIIVQQNITPPPANAGPDGIIHCNQLQTPLLATPVTGMTYQWATDANGQIVSGHQSVQALAGAAGVYTLTVTNPSNGCTATDVAQVSAVPLPDFSFELTQPDCREQLGVLTIQQVTGGAAPFSYSFDGGQQFINQLTQQLTPGTYAVMVRDAYGCTAAAQAMVEPPFFPSLSLPEEYRIEQGDSVQLVPISNPPAQDIQIWQWTPDTHLNCTDCNQPWAAPFKTTEYFLTITDQNGCTASARTRVEVDMRRHIYAPNVFTPDQAGDNNRFTIFGRGIVEIQSLSVFDRWGNMVWQGPHLAPNDLSVGWDGSIAGKAVNPGVFVWQALILFPDGTVEVYAGDVTVMR